MLPTPSDLPTHLGVAVSGGVDSMVLLDWLARFHRPALVLHVHHHLRPEADLDRDLVVERCRALGLRHRVLDVTVRRQNSIQQQARSARYGAMAQACLREGLTHLVTAHHRGDAVETAVGADQQARTTAGLAVKRTMQHWGITLHRPLILIDRREILRYAAENDVRWREDTSNTDPKYLRAQLRSQDLSDVELPSVQTLPRFRRVGADTIRVALEHVANLPGIVREEFPTCAVSTSALSEIRRAIAAGASRQVDSHGVELWIGPDIVIHRTLGRVRPLHVRGPLCWSGQVGSVAAWTDQRPVSKPVREKLRTSRQSGWYRMNGPVGVSETDPRQVHLFNEDIAELSMARIDALEF